jgi:hypothetical protein
MLDPYLIASTPQELVDWGSHVVFVDVQTEREVEARYPAQGQGRELDLRVDQVLWSHPQAVTPVVAGAVVGLEVSPGWSNGDPAVLEGTERLEVGRTYTVTLVDGYHEGEQYLGYLFGSIAPADADDAASLRGQLSTLEPDPERAPRPREEWDARFLRGSSG